MKALFRIVVALLFFMATYPVANLFLYFFLPFGEKAWIYNAASFLVAAICGLYLWRALQSPLDSFDRCVTIGAIGLGSFGFCAGYYGPLYLSPGANQGPLLGIFFTGPLGFVLGAVGGWMYWHTKGKKKAGHEDD